MRAPQRTWAWRRAVRRLDRTGVLGAMVVVWGLAYEEPSTPVQGQHSLIAIEDNGDGQALVFILTIDHALGDQPRLHAIPHALAIGTPGFFEHGKSTSPPLATSLKFPHKSIIIMSMDIQDVCAYKRTYLPDSHIKLLLDSDESTRRFSCSFCMLPSIVVAVRPVSPHLFPPDRSRGYNREVA
ncbi:hypothetical protein AG1IA_05161 [Rhizoctonia solani AG-1 IA]|uniref:Uncharacterized protein n=1 Tax=Thanatephorus cucumeris (strain AG1-IA) TaxID=983506 RepID=L8WS73_THACA|nr:hypothetical protein AG1IA_05161 [Rhizoctonia solani AG-1 IA]